MVKSTGSLLSDHIARDILQEISEGVYRNRRRLPTERDMAVQMNVSRTVIRDALSMLENEGFISRKQGLGTIINRHVVDVPTRMDLELEFLDMVRDIGKEPAITILSIRNEPADAVKAGKLGIHEGDELLVVERVVSADGENAIYCCDYISKALILDDSYVEEELHRPIFYFLEKYCQTSVYMDMTEVNAVAADEKFADIFDIEVGAPILHMDEIGYNFIGDPVIYSDESYKEGTFHHYVLRKKI
jgi:GntR family transcriptional regulator